MHNILLVLVGAIVGALARFIGPGKPPGPLVASMFLGVAGALAGQFLGRLAGFSHADESADFLTAIVGAVLSVTLYRVTLLRRPTN
jgi:uncharacterized membrane protein YeaQ/YmgE (transglycosylase-associated protein family)